mmetsp:Transcript_12399/g.20831  ORF Transcript_12399/g.20831 Transcript_12399/m.20831 type:complete len:82 (+) Transcript_12399:1-246(+)
MTLRTEFSSINEELDKKFELQPMAPNNEPFGDLMQISVPNSTSEEQYTILVQAFMRASRLPFPPKESYWASNIVFGFGMGT